MFSCFPGFSGQSQTRLWPVTWRKQRRGRWSRLWPLQSHPKHPIRERRLGRLEHQDLGGRVETYAFGSFFCFFLQDSGWFLIVMDCVYLCTCKGVSIYTYCICIYIYTYRLHLDTSVPPSTVSTGEASVVSMALKSETLQLWNEPCA